MSRELLCQSCGEQKLNLQRIKSSLINSMELTMCKSCIDNKYEPRYIVILAVRSVGLSEAVNKIIKERRYVGEVIAATDILS